MRPLKVKAKVIEEYNDSLNNNKLVELDDIIELDYARFEQLQAKGKVIEIKEPIIKKENKEDKKENE